MSFYQTQIVAQQSRVVLGDCIILVYFCIMVSAFTPYIDERSNNRPSPYLYASPIMV